MVRERQAQLLDDDKPCWLGPVCRCTCVCVHTNPPFYICARLNDCAVGALAHPRVAVAFAGFIIGTASQPATQAAAVARALSPKHPCPRPLARPQRATSLAFGPDVQQGFRSQRRSSPVIQKAVRVISTRTALRRDERGY